MMSYSFQYVINYNNQNNINDVQYKTNLITEEDNVFLSFDQSM